MSSFAGRSPVSGVRRAERQRSAQGGEVGRDFEIEAMTGWGVRIVPGGFFNVHIMTTSSSSVGLDFGTNIEHHRCA